LRLLREVEQLRVARGPAWARRDTLLTVGVTALVATVAFWPIVHAPPSVWVNGIRYQFMEARVDVPAGAPGVGASNEAMFGQVAFRFWVEAATNVSPLRLAGVAAAPNLPTGWFAVESPRGAAVPRTWLGPSGEFGVAWAGGDTVGLLVRWHEGGI